MLAPWIISHFPDHRVYVEPYGGAASVLLRKPRCYAEVYNDLDSEVVNLFRQVRDNGLELRRVLSLTPYSREEFFSAWSQCDDPLEQARRTVVRAFMGFASSSATMKRGDASTGLPGTGFRSNSNRSGTTPAHDWKNFSGTGFRTYTGESDGSTNRRTIPSGDWDSYEDALMPIIERLRGVVIENKDAIEVMLNHDGAQTLHYVDPPYVAATRDGGEDYCHEMSDDDHRKLAGVLNNLAGAVVVSGYACPLYDQELFADWKRIERPALADGARPRTEVLWLRNVTLPQSELSFAP